MKDIRHIQPLLQASPSINILRLIRRLNGCKRGCYGAWGTKFKYRTRAAARPGKILNRRSIREAIRRLK